MRKPSNAGRNCRKLRRQQQILYIIKRFGKKQIYCITKYKNKYVKPAGIQKWQSVTLGLTSEEEWPDIFWRSYRYSRETTLQFVQFKIVHIIIICNKKTFWYEITRNASMLILRWTRWRTSFFRTLRQREWYMEILFYLVELHRLFCCGPPNAQQWKIYSIWVAQWKWQPDCIEFMYFTHEELYI